MPYNESMHKSICHAIQNIFLLFLLILLSQSFEQFPDDDHYFLISWEEPVAVPVLMLMPVLVCSFQASAEATSVAHSVVLVQ